MFNNYLNDSEIQSAIDNLVSAYPALCEKIPLQYQTYERRVCYAMRAGQVRDQTRAGLLFTGSTHGDEWGGVEICICLVADILESYSLGTGLVYGGKTFTRQMIINIVEGMNVFVIPCVNPDGRNYSQNDAGYYGRKNRNPAGGGNTWVGVDINRNQDALWDFEHLCDPAGIGHMEVSSDPNSDVYHGPSAQSEAEARNIKWILDQNPNIRWYTDIHSSGCWIQYPWFWDDNQSDNREMNFRNPAYDGLRGIPVEYYGVPSANFGLDGSRYREYIDPSELQRMVDIAYRMRDAIQSVRGEQYTPREGAKMYPATGSNKDYAYARHIQDPSKGKIYASYTLEFGHAFVPPWNEMVNVIADVCAGLIEFACASFESIIVELLTPQVSFYVANPDLNVTSHVMFSVLSSQQVTFRILSGPTVSSGSPGTSFGAPSGTTFSLPPTMATGPARELAIPISFHAATNNDAANGWVIIECLETSQRWEVLLHGEVISGNCIHLIAGCRSPIDFCKHSLQPCLRRIWGCLRNIGWCRPMVVDCKHAILGCHPSIIDCRNTIGGCMGNIICPTINPQPLDRSLETLNVLLRELGEEPPARLLSSKRIQAMMKKLPPEMRKAVTMMIRHMKKDMSDE